MRAAVEHGSRRRARTCGSTIFQSLYFVYSSHIVKWKMGVVTSATTRFLVGEKAFPVRNVAGVIHTLGAARCPGRLSSGVPLGTLRRLAVLHPLRRMPNAHPAGVFRPVVCCRFARLFVVRGCCRFFSGLFLWDLCGLHIISCSATCFLLSATVACYT